MPFTHFFRSLPHGYRTVYLLACEIEHCEGMFLALRTGSPTETHKSTVDAYTHLFTNQIFLFV